MTNKRRRGQRLARRDTAILTWARKIRWEKRVKAVCKPCWEVKYCPYGPMVEQFPLKREHDDISCRIFGHDCPVFSLAEPFTETKQLRNISRTILRAVQFRVLKRENQICGECGKAVVDAEVEFDHVIPWSKGGSSDESNIRLLCKWCNRKRGAGFEQEFLVNSVRDHLIEPSGVETVEWILMIARFGWDFYHDENRLPIAGDYANTFTKGEISPAEEFAAHVFADILAFFQGRKPGDLTSGVFKALRLRWGAADGDVHRINDVSQALKISAGDLVSADRGFLQRLGFSVRTGKAADARWSNL